MNSWEDEKFVAAVKTTGRKKLIMAALWTEVCLTFPALEAIKAGYEVYAVEDASGGTSVTAHNAAMRRIEQAGAVPMTALQVLLEYQRDWAHKETYNAVMEIVKEHCGAYGQGVWIRLHHGARCTAQPEWRGALTHGRSCKREWSVDGYRHLAGPTGVRTGVSRRGAAKFQPRPFVSPDIWGST